MNTRHETPDRWLIVELDGGNYKVFGTWHGGYVAGNSWRMNSGIVRVDEDKEAYHFVGHSGSVYHCRKGSYGTTEYGNQVLEGILGIVKKRGFGYMIPLEDQNWVDFFQKNL